MYFTGKLQKVVGGKSKKQYLRGNVCGIPVMAFWGSKDADTLYITVDHQKIAYLAERNTQKLVDTKDTEEEIDTSE